MDKKFTISGKLVDVFNKEIYNTSIDVENGKIKKIKRADTEFNNYILPGFIDAHVHIESSMLVPVNFAKAAVRNGTVASVSDPHEIANVLGVKGVEYMIENGKKSPFKFFFGAPSCVPATSFETSGAVIDSVDIKKMMENPDIYYLAEMMNFPGVIFGDNEVLKKLKFAREANKPVDGHAPGLKGENLAKYAEQNITTDHECTTVDEAIEKIKSGIKIQIREGSAAKNFENLFPLIKSYPDKIMFCTDDCHPDDLLKGHINKIVSRAIHKGADLYDTLAAATLNPVLHYNLPVGLLREGDDADIAIVKDLSGFDVVQTYIRGELVFDHGKINIETEVGLPVNHFECDNITETDIQVENKSEKIKVIVAFDGDLITGSEETTPKVSDNQIVSDTDRDILKIVVVNRYKRSKPQVGFIRNFGLKKGAMAGSIAHDSHNIIAIGVSDTEIVKAVNRIIDYKGGIVACYDDVEEGLKLNIAGLMSTESAEVVAEKYHKVNEMVKSMGSTLGAPFMTMAFMALLVIPELKIGDKGLFDVSKFSFTSLYV
ncbi:MAG TPA: adenine deaminase [Bacteroidales bacterium]|nr:adenine deaminase [Bacteroidales bacterium]